MPNKAQKDPVIEFILDRIPAGLMAAYRRLSNLSYPVTDLKAFADLLGKYQDEEEEFVNSLLRAVFNIDSFPLGSLQNAFEKFHAHLPLTLQIVPLGRDLPPEEHPVELPSSLHPALTSYTPIIESNLPSWWNAWLGRNACRVRCEDEYQRCIDSAGHNDNDIFKCIVQRHFCTRRCG